MGTAITPNAPRADLLASSLSLPYEGALQIRVVLCARGRSRGHRPDVMQGSCWVMAAPEKYFEGLEQDRGFGWLDSGQLRALSGVRAALSRVAPRCVVPAETSGSISDWVELSLEIPHAREPGTRIELHFGDGYLVLSWPGGMVTGGWDWRPELAGAVEAMLSGRNRQTVVRVLGHAVPVETEIWDLRGNVRVVDAPRLTRLKGALLRPLATGRERRRSISFDRVPAIESER
jgi:hypothetical protein